MSLSAVFAVLSGIVQFLLVIPIIYGIFRGTNKPSTTSTGIWALVGLTLLVSSYFAGVRTNLPYITAGLLSTGTIFVLSIRCGYRKWSIIDPICLILAVTSLVIWWLTKHASNAVYLLTLVDWIAIVPVIYKSWLDPETESKLAWEMNFVACVLLVLSIRNFNAVTLVVAITQISHSLIINGLLRISPHKKLVKILVNETK